MTPYHPEIKKKGESSLLGSTIATTKGARIGGLNQFESVGSLKAKAAEESLQSKREVGEFIKKASKRGRSTKKFSRV